MNKSSYKGCAVDNRIPATVRKLVALLANQDYAEIARWTGGVRLPEYAIADSIREYGTTLILPPEPFYTGLIDVVEIEDSSPRSWSVVFPLWTKEEAESDLSGEITCRESGTDILEVELDNIHVL